MITIADLEKSAADGEAVLRDILATAQAFQDIEQARRIAVFAGLALSTLPDDPLERCRALRDAMDSYHALRQT